MLLVLQSPKKVGKFHPGLAGAFELLPGPCSLWHGPIVELCVVLGIFSFARPLTRDSTLLVLLLLVSLIPGVVILVSLVQGPQ
jgi:hypothetical protein